MKLLLIASHFVLALTVFSFSEKCSSRTPLRLNPVMLISGHPFGFSQISLDRKTEIASIAGQTSWLVNGTVMGSTAGEQLRHASRNVRLAIQVIGETPQRVSRMLAFVVAHENEELPDITELGKEFRYPSISLIGISKLAKPEFLIEIEAVLPFSSAFNALLSDCQCDGFFVDPECEAFNNLCTSAMYSRSCLP